MPQRTRADLDQQVAVISTRTGKNHRLDKATGGTRLVVEHGKGWDNASPRMTTGQLYDWMNAYAAGIDVGYRVGWRRATAQATQ